MLREYHLVHSCYLLLFPTVGERTTVNYQNVVLRTKENNKTTLSEQSTTAYNNEPSGIHTFPSTKENMTTLLGQRTNAYNNELSAYISHYQRKKHSFV